MHIADMKTLSFLAKTTVNYIDGGLALLLHICTHKYKNIHFNDTYTSTTDEVKIGQCFESSI